MALLFAEKGVKVLLQDPSEESVNQVLETAKKDGLQHMLEKHEDYKDLCDSLDKPKVFVFSLPHGTVGDSVVDGLHPYLEKGDVIIDASNEHVSPTISHVKLLRLYRNSAHRCNHVLSRSLISLIDVLIAFLDPYYQLLM